MNSEFQDTTQLTHNANQQLIWWRRYEWTEEISNREITVSDQSSPTNKSTAHLEVAYQDSHWQVYQQVNQQVKCPPGGSLPRHVPASLLISWPTSLPTSQQTSQPRSWPTSLPTSPPQLDKAACQESKHDVDRTLTEANLEWLLVSQGVCTCLGRVPMTTACKLYSADHADALHQQNVFESLGASRSVWEDEECKLRCINFRRVSDPRRAFRPAFGVTEISDD